MITECPRRKRSPSSTEPVDARLAPATGGAGDSLVYTTRATAYVATSTRYAVVTPKAPMRPPASAGPAIIPNDP
jgi:hypothetical protein